jgi:TonB-dependent SusC/RagA subfamily outer membrane receptor
MRKIAKQLQLVLCGLLLPFVLLAQSSVTGKVTDAAGNPLAGATVVSRSTNSSVQTDGNGAFTIKVSGSNPKLVVSFIGFASLTVSASDNVTVVLQEDVTKMSEVVVTGVASGVKRSNSANSVATLNSKELTGITRPPTLDGAMSGKVAGAQMSANSGAPGGGFSMRLRGISSVIGSSEPLLVVDGVIINNDQFPTGAGTGAFNGATGAAAGTQDQAPNRIADINPADIESINILKGPSAASMYGSRANAGVIVITTKRGKLGKTSINISQDFGIAQAQRLLGSSDWTPAKIATYGGAYGLTVAEANAALTAANGKPGIMKILFSVLIGQ